MTITIRTYPRLGFVCDGCGERRRALASVYKETYSDEVVDVNICFWCLGKAKDELVAKALSEGGKL